MDRINIFVFDDHAVTLAGICAWFDPDVDFIKVCGNGADVFETGPTGIPNDVTIIVLDLYLQHTDPYLNIETLRRWYPDKKIIIFTSEDSMLWQRGLFKHGISAYVVKSISVHDFKQTIRKVADGQVLRPEFISDEISSTEWAGSMVRGLDLPKGEKMTLEQFFEGKGIKEIADLSCISAKAIDKRMQRIRKKFNVESNLKLLIKVIQRKIS